MFNLFPNTKERINNMNFPKPIEWKSTQLSDDEIYALSSACEEMVANIDVLLEKHEDFSPIKLSAFISLRGTYLNLINKLKTL